MHEVTQRAYAELDGAHPPSTVLLEREADTVADLGASPALVAVLDGAVVGAVRTAPEDMAPDRLLRVRRVAVDPAARRRGVASLLLRAAVELGMSAGYTGLRAAVRVALRHNHVIYDNLGWAVVARDEHWLSYGLPLPRPVVDAATMADLGSRLARCLRPGDLVVLAGPLGAGKTVLAQGIGAGLEVPERITSPTFVLAREHGGGRLPLLHVDAYRLASLDELDDLDLDTTLPDAVTVVEWGAGLAEPLADGHLLIEIHRSDDPADEVRHVVLRGVGPAWAARQTVLDVTC